MDGTTSATPTPAKEPRSGIAGPIIIVIILIIGAIYLFSSRSEQPMPVEQDGGIGNTPGEESIDNLSNELNAVDTNFDADLNTLETELSQ